MLERIGEQIEDNFLPHLAIDIHWFGQRLDRQNELQLGSKLLDI
jgi:hypothetical protein